MEEVSPGKRRCLGSCSKVSFGRAWCGLCRVGSRAVRGGVTGLLRQDEQTPNGKGWARAQQLRVVSGEVQTRRTSAWRGPLRSVLGDGPLDQPQLREGIHRRVCVAGMTLPLPVEPPSLPSVRRVRPSRSRRLKPTQASR